MTVDDSGLLAPLADDCERLRRTLLQNPLPPVWQLEAAEARRLHRELTLASRSGWRPALAGLGVSVSDIPALGARPAMRQYQPAELHAGAARVDEVTGPCVVWMHGGGWVLGDLDTTDAIARTICHVSGWRVLSVDYRCTPAAPFPAAVDDTLAALDWALARHPRVVVGGDSAGGNLAGVAAQVRGGHPALVGQVLVYPTVDPRLESASAHEFVEGPFLTRRDMEWFYAQYLTASEDVDSPLVDLARDFDARSVVPVDAVLLTVGHDPLRDEGIAYGRVLADRGARVHWIHAPELYHGAYSSSGFLPSSAARVREVWASAHQLFT